MRKKCNLWNVRQLHLSDKINSADPLNGRELYKTKFLDFSSLLPRKLYHSGARSRLQLVFYTKKPVSKFTKTTGKRNIEKSSLELN
jgi:hypothetical protein